jgi:hypothetical protein
MKLDLGVVEHDDGAIQGCWTHSNLGLMVIAATWAGACAYGYCTGFFS